MVDNLIKLFDATDTDFSTNGIGILLNAESCFVTEERNGSFELEMVYPIDGRYYSDISLRKIIVVKSNPYSTPQPFRIYSISKPIDGRVTINAEHISYDLSGYPVSAFSLEEPNTTIQNVFDEFKNQCVTECPFTFWTNKIATGKFSTTTPRSMRSLLAGSEGSILDRYGTAEYEFDGYSVRLWMSRGEDKGVTIRYGKNLTDIEQEENCSSVYTAVYPYWYSEMDGKLVTLHEADVKDTSEKDEDGNYVIVHIPEKIVEAEGTFSFVRILTLDLSDKFTERPKELDLYKAAKKYIKDNDIGIPKVSIEVSFEPLSKTSDYKDYAILEEVRLCDTVYVEFPELGVSATAKCIETVYDALSDKYDKIELGSIKNNLANSLSEQSKTLSNTTSKSYVDKLLDETIMAVSGNSGGYVVIHSSKGGKSPDEILIMDEPEIKNAQRIWRWNMSGLCYTDRSYSSFAEIDEKNKVNNTNKGVAITMDGKIVADFIAGNMIQGVGLQTAPDEKGKIWFEVTNDGTLTANKGIIGGCKIQNGKLVITEANIDDLTVSRLVFKGTPIGDIETDEEGKVVDEGEDDGLSGLYIDQEGLLTAKNALIYGTVYASEGRIAGLHMLKQTPEDSDRTYCVFTDADDVDVDNIDDVDVFSNFRISVITKGELAPDESQSAITIGKLQVTNGTFSGDVEVGGKLKVGSVLLDYNSISLEDSPIMSFDTHSDSETYIRVKLSCSGKTVIATFDVAPRDGRTISFKIKYHYILGNWSSEKNFSCICDGVTKVFKLTYNTTGTNYDKVKFVSTGTNECLVYDAVPSRAVNFFSDILPDDDIRNLGGAYDPWGHLYVNYAHIEAEYAESSAMVASDRNVKKDILVLSDVYDSLFDRLVPVSYRYKDNKSNRIHIGFIAQDVKDALDECNISTTDFAAYCEDDSSGEVKRSLRYGEFVALNTYEIQKLKARVREIEEKLKKT